VGCQNTIQLSAGHDYCPGVSSKSSEQELHMVLRSTACTAAAKVSAMVCQDHAFLLWAAVGHRTLQALLHCLRKRWWVAFGMQGIGENQQAWAALTARSNAVRFVRCCSAL
jgi:hypothetical protein